MLKRRHFWIASSTLILGWLVACAPAADEEELSSAEVDAIVNLLIADLEGGAVGEIGLKGLTAGNAESGLSPMANCTPQKLTPPQACPSGGNIYTTMNMTCPNVEAETACCAKDPPCSKWTSSYSATTGTNFNSCKTAPNVTVSGSWNGALSGTITGSCGGLAKSNFTLTNNGSFSVLVNGKEVCPGFSSLRITVDTYAQSVIFVSGTICGKRVSMIPRVSPCKNSCGSFCCPQGSTCGQKTDRCLSPSFPVDCGDYACPSGTKCAANNKCSF
jgi:hypothetical protein